MNRSNYKLIFVPAGKMNVICDLCKGNGVKPCYRCDQTGTFEDGSTCPICHGDKVVKCEKCGGYGYIDD